MKKKLSNNKGFSLVELIIVIAIMAVLIGVLAPQYLRYVEKSKVSADLDTIDGVVSAIETTAADPDGGITGDTSFTLAENNGTTTLSGGDTTSLAAVKNIVGDTLNLKSKTYSGQSITIDVTFAAEGTSKVMLPKVTVTDNTGTYTKHAASSSTGK